MSGNEKQWEFKTDTFLGSKAVEVTEHEFKDGAKLVRLDALLDGKPIVLIIEHEQYRAWLNGWHQQCVDGCDVAFKKEGLTHDDMIAVRSSLTYLRSLNLKDYTFKDLQFCLPISGVWNRGDVFRDFVDYFKVEPWLLNE